MWFQRAWLLAAALIMRWVLCQGQQETDMELASKQAMEQVLKGAVQLDLSLQDPDDELFVSILTEDGYKVCEGKLNKDLLDGIACFYDKSFLKVGDNVFHISVYSTKRKEIVLRTTRLFAYEGPHQPKWPFQQAAKPAALAAVLGGGGLLLRSLLRRKPVVAMPPAIPVADNPATYARPPSGLVSRKTKAQSSRHLARNTGGLALKAVAFCSGLFWMISAALRRSSRPSFSSSPSSPLATAATVRVETSPLIDPHSNFVETTTMDVATCPPPTPHLSDSDVALDLGLPSWSLVTEDAQPTPLGIKAVISATLLLSQALIVSAHHLLMVAFFGRNVPAPTWQDRLVPLKR